MGITMACANIPQAVKIFKRKSAKDISPITFIIITIGAAVWVAYGVYKNDIPIFLANIVGVFATGAVVVGYLLYK